MANNRHLVVVFLVLICLPVIYPKDLVVAKDTVGSSWETKAPMNVARIFLGTATVNDQIFALGGISSNQNDSTSCSQANEMYNPSTDSWVSKAPMPTPRYAFATAVLNDKIYCIGGKSNGFSAMNTNEVYDPASDTWKTLKPMPTARTNIQAEAVNGKIYVIGGRVSDQIDFNSTTFSINEVYDPITDSWSIATPMPQPAALYVSAVVGPKIFVITSNLTMIYDTQNDSWSEGTPPPIDGLAVGSITTGRYSPLRIYVFSDVTVQIYDPRTDSWKVTISQTKVNNNPGITVLNDKFYLLGGWIVEKTTEISGEHSLHIGPYAEVYTNTNLVYTPSGYGTAGAQELIVLSPGNMTYNSSSVELILNVSEPVSWLGYSLDEKENSTLTGNATLTELSNGSHKLIVYANNTDGTTTSQMVLFTVEATSIAEQAVPIIGVVAVSSSVGGAVYFLKHKRAVANGNR